MSSALLPHQDISGTFGADGSIALAGLFPNLTNVAIGTRESSRPPKPFSTVPFRRDPDFVDRADLLSRVDERCSEPAGRAALVGLGGVGKSQLAIEYTHRTRERSPDTWVFWVHASNAARFEQGYRDIANVIKIVGREDPKVDIFKLVHDWLRGCEGKWLMVLDNVDDADFLVNAHTVIQGQSSDSGRQIPRPLRDYLPQSQNGSILITTRSRESALKLSDQNELIQVEPMDASSAIKLLEKKLKCAGQGNNKDHIELLAARLEFMPLAIIQATSYISQLSPRYSVRQYIEDFRKSDRKKTSLLNHEGGQLRRDWEAKNSIIITWQISFEHIRRNRPSAADLLSLMSFCDRQGIPEVLVRNRAESGNGHGSQEEHDEHDGREEEESDDDNISECSEDDGFEDDNNTSECSEDDAFKDDVQILRDYSFLSLNTDRTFEMHALVQLATRKWLDANGELEQWKQCYIRGLSAEFPTGEYENWTDCQALFPHAMSAVAQRPREDESLREWASLLYNAAWYAWRKGSITEAVNLSEIATEVRKKILGREHKETLRSVKMAGLAYNLGGRWKEAEELHVQVIDIEKRVLGDKHLNRLTSMINLASIYCNQGRWKEAEELAVKVIEIDKSVLGEEHPSTLTSIQNLATTYESQGRSKEAEELEVEVVEVRKRVLGEEHPHTLNSMNVLALIYKSQGRLKEAEEVHVQVIEIGKRLLGDTHPDTLISMNNLALTYWKQRRWKEAEELEVQVVEIRKRVLGDKHPSTLTSMNNLAFTWKDQGRVIEAISLMKRCVQLRKQILGPEHPDTETSLKTLCRWEDGGHVLDQNLSN